VAARSSARPPSSGCSPPSSPSPAGCSPELLEDSYGIDGFITERTVDVHVMKLRKKIEPDPRRPSWLLTVYGIGYKLAIPSSQDR
jgi:DNA-binding response OmpR family regulator